MNPRLSPSEMMDRAKAARHDSLGLCVIDTDNYPVESITMACEAVKKQYPMVYKYFFEEGLKELEKKYPAIYTHFFLYELEKTPSVYDHYLADIFELTIRKM